MTAPFFTHPGPLTLDDFLAPLQNLGLGRFVERKITMGGALERALPMAMAIFCGVAGGFYTFQPMLAPKESPETLQNAVKSADAKMIDPKANDPNVVTRPISKPS